jgi:hypothetical protein
MKKTSWVFVFFLILDAEFFVVHASATPPAGLVKNPAKFFGVFQRGKPGWGTLVAASLLLVALVVLLSLASLAILVFPHIASDDQLKLLSPVGTSAVVTFVVVMISGAAAAASANLLNSVQTELVSASIVLSAPYLAFLAAFIHQMHDEYKLGKLKDKGEMPASPFGFGHPLALARQPVFNS